MKFRMTVAGTALGLLACSTLAAPAPVEAQGPDGRWPLQPSTGYNRVVAPFMEGWYRNEDGTYSISFGYLNQNDTIVEIPLGENNFIEPAQFDGMQPTYFETGHPRGLFTVTLPASMRDVDVWWNIRNPNGELTRVPGRTNASAYQLDWTPRPHGSVPPRVTFEGESGVGRGPPGVMSERILTGRVGQPIVLSMNVEDISVRDLTDVRFRDVPVRAVWAKHQGPVGGMVEFTRHEAHPLPPPPEEAASDDPDASPAGGRGRRPPPPPNQVSIPDGRGMVRVYAAFSAPGEYVMRAQVDNFSVADSNYGDQCCWTNAYVRVNVTQ